MNKKIVMSLSVIAAVSAAVIGGTGAFFSDTETSTGNTFTAGAIDLKVDSQQHYNGMICRLADPGEETYEGYQWQPEGDNTPVPYYPAEGTPCGGTWELKDLEPTMDKFFNFSDVKPGDEGENTISLHVVNNDAWVCAEVSNLANNDNGLTEPEGDVDVTDGAGNGELQQNLVVTIWKDDGDNIQEGGEPTLYTGAPQAGSWALYDSTTGNGPLASGDTGYLGVAWSLPLSTGNQVQTDSMAADVSFKVIQSRNNGDFVCGEEAVVVTANDLAQSFGEVASNVSKWLFYNDTNDTVMTLNQFSGDGGVNDIVAGPGAVGAAQMTLHEAAARYNIATYKYKNVKLSDINSLKYRVYDDSASSETPYLHFNIDFFNTDTWQNRLVQVPTGVSVDTWTTVDALAGSWTYSGANWPAGLVNPVQLGSTPKTWAQILADYPNAETRSTDSFFGVRVGHPGPDNETGFVDWIEFDGETTDFEN